MIKDCFVTALGILYKPNETINKLARETDLKNLGFFSLFGLVTIYLGGLITGLLAKSSYINHIDDASNSSIWVLYLQKLFYFAMFLTLNFFIFHFSARLFGGKEHWLQTAKVFIYWTPVISILTVLSNLL